MMFIGMRIFFPTFFLFLYNLRLLIYDFDDQIVQVVLLVIQDFKFDYFVHNLDEWTSFGWGNLYSKVFI